MSLDHSPDQPRYRRVTRDPRSTAKSRFSRDARDSILRVWRHAIGELVRRLLPKRRPRANPRVVERKYTRWHVKRARHRDCPQPTRPPDEAVVI